MNFNISNIKDKSDVFKKITEELRKEGITIVSQDETRPWGGFFVIDESQALVFASKFIPHLDLGKLKLTNKLSPKILLVEPAKRLSWQYHHRRTEVWNVVCGPVGVKTSLTDNEGELQSLATGKFIHMDKGERHRLIGLDSWGVVAEIWMHTDIHNPSNEEDIIRLQDDYGR